MPRSRRPLPAEEANRLRWLRAALDAHRYDEHPAARDAARGRLVARIRALLGAGWTAGEVGQALGVSRQAVHSMIRTDRARAPGVEPEVG